MGSFKTCIPGYVPRDLQSQLNDARDQWIQAGKDPASAEFEAASAVLRRSVKREQQTAISALRSQDLTAAMEANARPDHALASRLTGNDRGLNSDQLSAEAWQRVVGTQARAKMDAVAELAAQTSRRDLRRVGADFLRALDGKKVSDPLVARAAKGWETASGWIKDTFNAEGGDVKTRADWRMPESHEGAARAMQAGGKAGADAKARWIEETAGEIESGARWPLTGPNGAPIAGDELRGQLGKIADSIRTGNTTGTIGVIPGGLKNRHLDPRSIGFKDVEARIAYDNRWGNADVFTAIDRHVRTYSREIGLMKVLGPNGDNAFAVARQYAAEHGGDSTYLSSVLDSKYLALSGALDRPGSVWLANLGGSARSFLSAAFLPLGVATRLSHIVPVSLTSSLYGVPVMKTLSEFLTHLAPIAAEDRGFLVRMGVDLESMAAQLEQQGVMDSASKSRWFAEATQRYSGAHKLTEAASIGSQRGMMGAMADYSRLPFAEADRHMNGMLSHHGWDERQWAQLAEHGITENDGARWATVDAIEKSSLSSKAKDALEARLLYTVQSAESIGITRPDATVRAIMSAGLPRGTVGGEAALMTTQFKAYAARFTMNQIGLVMQMPTMTARAGYASKLLLATTAMGMVSMQVKRLLKGQGLADMSQPSAMTAAMLQGGGLGIIGDFASSGLGGENRFGKGFVETLLGPSASAIDDFTGLTFGNAVQAAQGQNPNFTAEAVRLAGRYTPLVNLPFLGLAAQRLIVDQARLWADPSGTRRSFMSMEQKQREDFNSRDWWRHGQTSPEFAR